MAEKVADQTGDSAALGSILASQTLANDCRALDASGLRIVKLLATLQRINELATNKRREQEEELFLTFFARSFRG